MTLRVASLLPCATEIVCGLEARDELVGISHECDFPSGLEGIPSLTRARLSMDGLSAEVDRDVRKLLEDSLAVYEVDVDALAEVQPSIVITQDLCEVCAVALDDVRAALGHISSGAQVLSLSPTRLAHVFDNILQVGTALGR